MLNTWAILIERDNTMFESVLQAIKDYDRIIIHRHSNPDGDALGSQIGLKHIILHNFPHKPVLSVGDGARHYSFMDDSSMDEVAAISSNSFFKFSSVGSTLISFKRY